MISSNLSITLSQTRKREIGTHLIAIMNALYASDGIFERIKAIKQIVKNNGHTMIWSALEFQKVPVGIPEPNQIHVGLDYSNPNRYAVFDEFAERCDVSAVIEVKYTLPAMTGEWLWTPEQFLSEDRAKELLDNLREEIEAGNLTPVSYDSINGYIYFDDSDNPWLLKIEDISTALKLGVTEIKGMEISHEVLELFGLPINVE